MIELSIREEIGFIKLNNLKQLNAITIEMKNQFLKALQEYNQNPEVKVIFIHSAGEHFTSGSSVKNMGKRKITETMDHVNAFNEIIRVIHETNKIVISVLKGYCIGAGVGIAMASDFTFPSSDLKMSFPFTKIGLIPDSGTLYFLPRLVGPEKAKNIIMQAKTLEVNELQSLGIISETYNREDIEIEAMAFARKIISGPWQTYIYSKKIINKSDQLSLTDVLEYEKIGQSIMQQTKDHEEGIQAFREKRQTHFTGE